MRSDFDYKVEYAINSTLQVLNSELQFAIENSYKPEYIDALVNCIKSLVVLKSFN